MVHDGLKHTPKETFIFLTTAQLRTCCHVQQFAASHPSPSLLAVLFDGAGASFPPISFPRGLGGQSDTQAPLAQLDSCLVGTMRGAGGKPG